MGNSFREFGDKYDEGDFIGIQIFRTLVLSIALAIQCGIGFSTIWKIKQNLVIDSHVSKCFVVSFVSAICSTIGRIVLVLLPLWSRNPDNDLFYHIVESIVAVTLLVFYWSRLLTYIVRLHITFKGSVYRMSDNMIILFTIIMLLNAFFAISLLVIPAVIEHYGHTDIMLPIFVPLLITWFLLYIIGSLFAVHMFTANLSKLAESHSKSTRDVQSPDDVQLSEQQQNLADLSAKYTMLFTPAIISTILFILLHTIFGMVYDTGLFMLLYPVDLCVNLWCLNLQFSFAKHHYIRCCRCCDDYCRNYTRKRTRRLIYNHFNPRSSEMGNEHCVDGNDETMPLDPISTTERVAESGV